VHQLDHLLKLDGVGAQRREQLILDGLAGAIDTMTGNQQPQQLGRGVARVVGRDQAARCGAGSLALDRVAQPPEQRPQRGGQLLFAGTGQLPRRPRLAGPRGATILLVGDLVLGQCSRTNSSIAATLSWGRNKVGTPACISSLKEL
jgi:hypothetical protein